MFWDFKVLVDSGNLHMCAHSPSISQSAAICSEMQLRFHHHPPGDHRLLLDPWPHSGEGGRFGEQFL